MSVRDHRDLISWQRAMDLVAVCYKLTERLPNQERYGLANLLRRAAVSLPANITEGRRRRSTAEFLRSRRCE
jgi:four helix bundle protein